MAFRESETLDFTAQDIFVLTGPTGSGKSSILDAMSFALYGETPRMGSRDLKKLIYQDVENPAQKARVVFAFRHHGRDYRITRQISAQQHRVELDSREETSQDWEPYITGSVSEIKKLIPELLGLNFHAFRRVLLLPQGGFDQFLKQDNASDRRAMLMNLAQLGVYEKMQQAADVKRRAGADRLAHIKGELQGIGAVSAAELFALETHLESIEAQSRLDQESFEIADQQLKEAEQLWEALGREATLLSARERHRIADAEMQQLAQQVQRGEQLLVLHPQLNYLEKSLQKQQHLEKLHHSLCKDQALLNTQTQALEAVKSTLALQAAEQPEWQAELEALQALSPVLERYASLQGQGQELLAQQALHQQAKTQAQHKRDTAMHARQQMLQDLEQLEQELERFEVSTEDLTRLAEWGHQLSTLETHLQPALAQAKDAFQTWKQQARTLKERLDTAAEALTAAQNRRAGCRQALQQAQDELEQARQQSLALDLRRHLHTGQACPVCTQEVQHVPAASIEDLSPTALASVRQQLQRAESVLQEAETAEQAAFQAWSQAQSQWQAHEAQAGPVKAQRSQAYEAAKALTLSLREQLGVDTLPSLSSIRAQYSEQKKRLRQREHLIQAHRTQTQESQELALQVATAEATLHEKAEALTQLATQMTQNQQRLQETRERLTAVLGDNAAEAEGDYARLCQQRLRAVQKRLADYTQQQEDLREREQALQKQVLIHRERDESNQQQMEQLAEEIEQARTALMAACERLGYTQLKALREAMPEPGQLQSWQAQLQEHRSQEIALDQELLRVQEQVAGRTLDEAQLLQWRQNHQQLQEDVRERRTEAAVLRKDIQQARAQQARSQTLQQELDHLSAEQALYERIYHDLSSRHLPDFLAKRILERVMAEGSQELETLSNGRYRFELDENEELVVLDAWNAQEPRSVKTLSGGESFLASLALALALNRYLSQGIQLDSLFIDEGFGTLDAESLEMAASVVEKLQLSGKCVGIITHIPELAERFETRIEVVKSDTGARLQLS